MVERIESYLILLSPNKKSLGFSDLLEEVFATRYTYFQDIEFGYENYEVDFKNSVEEIYLKMENYLNEG